MIMHFKSQKDRLAFLKGNFEEIKPIEAKAEEIIPKVAEEKAEKAEPKAEEKPKKSKKSTKKAKKEVKDDEVQAE